MNLKTDKSYSFLLLLHILIGGGIFLMPFLSKLYGLAILVFGVYWIIRNGNRNGEALFAAAYLTGAEVFLRMTDGVFLYEFGKYGVMLFLLLGMFLSGFSKNAVPTYGLYLLLLIPGIIIATQTLSFDAEIRKRIAFNLSGPVCLGISAIYAYDRKISMGQLLQMLLSLGLPILSCAVYLTFYVPDLKSVITGTESNFAASGGFGPNQVATVLGLGMFAFLANALLASRNTKMLAVNLSLAMMIGYRGLVTFSRGGMLTGTVITIVLLGMLYLNTKGSGKIKLKVWGGLTAILFLMVWLWSAIQTDGMIELRYANKNAKGEIKQSKFTGREQIAESEINAFWDSPVFGIGVAKAKELREQEMGQEVASHSEVTRLLAEHGSLGILALLILTITPLLRYLNNPQHLFMLSFVLFWLLTINHAAMRIAAPAFVYALSVLRVHFEPSQSLKA